MKRDLASRAVKVTNAQLRHYNSLLRKNLRLVISCSSDNERAQQRIDRVEEMIFEAPTLASMFDTLVTQGRRALEIDHITVSLEHDLREHYPPDYPAGAKSVFLRSDRIIFSDADTMAACFKDRTEPVIRGNLAKGTEEFFPNGLSRQIKSEALAPMGDGHRLIGVVAFGSRRSTRFLEGYGSRFLKRFSRTLTLKVELFRALGAGWKAGGDVV